MSVTLFSWGYWGWGASTEQLIEATDLAERGRGFEPPIFVDVRLLRNGKAKEFVGNAFRNLVGATRYCWMDDLGNLGILDGEGGMRIKNPAAAADLLKLALQAAKERRRVIFYCACEFPYLDGKLACHRRKIIELLFANAKKIGKAISIVEWPGGEPNEVQIKVDRKLFSAVTRGRRSIPFSSDQLKEYGGLPWGSLAALECEDDDTKAYVLVGPAKFATSKAGKGYWYVPVIEPAIIDVSEEKLLRRADRWRTAHGLDERKSR
jgi:hypothetical protein